jgi:hypothetical protein
MRIRWQGYIRKAEALATKGRGSLRLRIGGWTVAVFTLTLALVTAAGILDDRRQLFRAQAEQARALLVHLAQMHEFRGDFETAASSLALVRDSLAGSGGSVELAPAGATHEARGEVVARQALSLGGGSFELLYLRDGGRVREMTRRSVFLHMVHGIVALGFLLAGMELILRRSLLVPLQALSHQVKRMQTGGGWHPVPPATDSELAELASAVENLGPGLEEQVHQWVNAERRSAVTLALNHIRVGLRGSLRDAQALIGDLQARRLVAPSGTPKLRSILGHLDEIREVLQIEEGIEMAHASWAGPEAGGEPSAPKEEKDDSR